MSVDAKSIEWVIKPIDDDAKNGQTVILINKDWDTMPRAKWDWVEEPFEDDPGFCLWHIEDTFWGHCEEGLIWPDVNEMPTHYIEITPPNETEVGSSKMEPAMEVGE